MMATSASVQAQVQPMQYPVAAKIPVTNEYYGIKVTEEYRWLENPVDSTVRDWVAKENALTHEYLASYPELDKIKQYLTKLYSMESSSYSSLSRVGGKLFALKQF